MGSTKHSSLTSEADVDKRIRSAAAAFEALRGGPCTFVLEGTLRGKANSVLVLALLLYDSEVWCFRGNLFANLRSFHNRCCHAMCRITTEHTGRCRFPRSSCTGASVLPLRNSTSAVVCPAGRATCRACP